MQPFTKVITDVVTNAVNNTLTVVLGQLAVNLDRQAFDLDPTNSLFPTHPDKIKAKVFMDLAMVIRKTIVDQSSHA